jgi:dynein heavy chain
VEELESYAKQVEEFHAFGDLLDVQRYLQKAQVLNGKLDAAADKVQLKSVKNEVIQ